MSADLHGVASGTESPFTARDGRSRVLAGGLTTALVLVTGAIWMSPSLPGPAERVRQAVAHAVAHQPDDAPKRPTPEERLRDQLAQATAELQRQRAATAQALQLAAAAKADAAGVRAVTALAEGTSPGGAFDVDAAVERPGAAGGGAASNTPTTKPATKPPTTKPPSTTRTTLYCDDFRWQQDAQAALAAYHSRAAQLDANGDGYACRGYLAVDPKRPATPLPKEPLPAAPTAAAIQQVPTRWFGVYTPTRVGEVDLVAASTQQNPSIFGFFGGWGSWSTAEDGTRTFHPEVYNSDRVVASWRRGLLPMLTWEPRPLNPGDSQYYSDFTLQKILDGTYDEYLVQYAAAVRDLGLPVAIRFAHEMNGDWYPWSEQVSGGSPAGTYAAAWRHVHDLFEQAGANDLVIWLWGPNRINNLRAAGQDLARYYPGDAYVDWMGMSGYLRSTATVSTATFEGTFGMTLRGLRQVAPGKPILLAEVGATETVFDGQGVSLKPRWITDLFRGLAAPENADVKGFVWFDLTKTALVDGRPQTNDWRIASTSASLTAFTTGIHDPALTFAAPYAE